MAKAAVNKTFPRSTATGAWTSTDEAPPSDSSLWSGYDAESTHEIAEGDDVTYDVSSSTALSNVMLTISGTLRVTNEYPVTALTVGAMHGEETGKLIIGDPDDLFLGTNRFVVTFDGDPPTSPATSTGHERSFMLHGSDGGGFEFSIYAEEGTPWVLLNANAAAAATVLTVTPAPTNWVSGDRIAISHTDFYPNDEPFETTVVSVVGTTLTIADALPTARWGVLQYATDNSHSGMHVTDVAAGWSTS